MVETTEVDERRPSAGRADAFNPNIHGARGLFSFGILVFHVVNSGLPTFGWLAAGPLVYFLFGLEHCVELFFSISGFVIVGTLGRAKSPAKFITDRAIRIFPTLWVTITALFIFDFFSHWYTFSAAKIPYFGFLLATNFLALPGILPLEMIHPAAWSLSYEMCFYLLCTVAWVQRRHFGHLWAVTTLPAAVVLLIFFPRAIAIPIGVLVALNYQDHLPRWLRRMDRLYEFPALYLAGFVLAWHTIQILSHQPIGNTNLIQWMGNRRILVAVPGALALLAGMTGVARGRSLIFCRILRLAPLQWLGTVSYSLYLWHPMILGLVKRGLKITHVFDHVGPASQLVFFLIAGAVSLVIAHFSQLWLERAAARWLKALWRGRSTKEPSPWSRARSPGRGL